MTPIKRPAREHYVGAIVATIVILALLAAAFGAHALHISGAATKTLADVNGTNGAKQARYHSITGPPRVIFLGPFGYHVKGAKECGPAVRLMEGALRRKHFRKPKPQNCVGIATRNQIKAFQRSIHYKPTGVYNLATHRALVERGGYSAQARRDISYTAHLAFIAHVQRNILTVTAHARLVGGETLTYSQGSERGYFPSWPRLPPATDCSGFVTWILFQSGVGASVSYFGPGSSVGWTGTLGRQGVVVGVNGPLHIGDLVFYGYGYPWGHVEIYIGHQLTEGHGSTGVHIHSIISYRSIGQVRRYF